MRNNVFISSIAAAATYASSSLSQHNVQLACKYNQNQIKTCRDPRCESIRNFKYNIPSSKNDAQTIMKNKKK